MDPARAQLGELPSLVGRGAEVVRLRDQLDRAGAGHGSLVLVSGEAGIGKTVLVTHLSQQAARRGALVLTGRSYDLTETPPYGPWIEAFRSLSEPDASPLVRSPFGPPAGGASSQDELVGLVRDALHALAAKRPLVLVVDDLHWADEASVELLRVVARDLHALPILLLATYRTEEITRLQPLYSRLPLLIREAEPVRLELARLEPEDVRQLVRGRYPLAHVADEDRLVVHLVERTGGNPFFLHELLGAMADGGILESGGAGWRVGDLAQSRLPSLLRQVSDVRLARLGEEARGLLEIAAIVGKVVPLALWATLANRPVDALLDLVERAVAASILVEDPDGTKVWFTHDLLREALYDGMLAARRRGWHRRVGEALAGDGTADPATIAYHFRAAGDAREADWLLLAAEQARALYLPAAAIDRFTRALALFHQQSRPVPVAVYRGRGLASQLLGDFAAARSDLETALALARSTGERSTEWQAFLDLGFLWEGHDYGQTAAYYQQALDLIRTSGDPSRLASTLNRFGVWHLNVDRPAGGLRHIQEAFAIYQQSHDRPGIATTLELLSVASLMAGDVVQAEVHGREAVAFARDLDDKQTLISALVGLSACGIGMPSPLVYPVPLVEAQACAEEAVELARAIDAPAAEAYALPFIALCLGSQGQIGRALEVGQRGVELSERIGHRERATSAHGLLAILYAELFAYDQAQLHFERAVDLARAMGSPYALRGFVALLAAVFAQRGEVLRAETLLAGVLGPDDPPNTEALRMCWHARAVVALAKNEPAQALTIANRLIATEPHWSDTKLSPQLADLRARALIALGRLAEADATLLAARRFAERQGARTLLWRIDASLALLHHRQARRGDADAAATRARGLVDELAGGLDAALRAGFLRGAAELLLTAPAPGVSHAGYPAGLSAREVEVLELLAAGLTNSEIAERLVLSARTINSHLTHIYTKLNVSSRGAAIRYALDHGLRGES